MKIEFAKGLSLPDDAATQTFAFIARKGAGKSYAAGKLVEGLPDGVIDIIPSGIQALGESVLQPMSTAQLVAQWKDKFPGKVGEMLDQLVSRFPAQMTKEELGQLVGITPTSGTFSTYLSKLRSNGLVVVDRQHGQLKASEDLFL